MGGTFYGLEIAKTGIFASQRALNIAGHNIANANTVGYTRQRLNLSSIARAQLNGILAPGEKAAVGGGVSANYIEQIRDKFYDSQFREENSLLCNWSIKSDALYYLEDIFNEPSQAGLSSLLTNFYDSLHQLSELPESKEVRTLVRQNAIKITEVIQHYSRKVTNLQEDQNEGIRITAHRINDLVKQVAELNEQILRYEMNGDRANDLKDKRNLALDELSGLVDIFYTENEKGVISIYIGKEKDNAVLRDDFCLLDGPNNQIFSLDVQKNQPDYYGNPDSFYSITLTSKGGNTNIIDGSALSAGKLKGYFDCRDGNTADNIGLPYVLEKLDALARGIVTAFNEVHRNGYGIPNDENGNVSMTNINFFDDQGGNINAVNASNIRISDEIMQSVYNIAASSELVDLSAGNTQKGNNENVMDLIDIREKDNLPFVGNIDDFLSGIISDIAIETEHCNKMLENQEIIFENIEKKRMSISAVSIDEEMTNIIMFEKSFAAASRVVTAIDEMLEVLINRTGLVGL